MKITIEHENEKTEVESPNATTLTEALELIQRALLGAGYCFKGELIIEETNEDSK